MSDGMSGGLLVAPERNNYFYGKLMDVVQFSKEQSYVNQKRWLLNRLLFGSGVVCGLDIIVDPQASGRLRLQPGIALDAAGHEIIVPEPVRFNPRQLTDEKGHPVGAPLPSGAVDVCLRYVEKRADLVPVLVADCDAPGNCAASTIREGFRVIVREADPNPPKPHKCELGEFPLPAGEKLHELLCKRIDAECPPIAADTCVMLARVTLPNGINTFLNRQLVYNNPLLEQLIVCLSDRVERLANGLILRYYSGDGQSAAPDTTLKNPLVVELVDGTGKGVAGKTVQFQVTVGNGNFNKAQSINVTTDSAGYAEAYWTLGPVGSGPQFAAASAVGSIFTVNFAASLT